MQTFALSLLACLASADFVSYEETSVFTGITHIWPADFEFGMSEFFATPEEYAQAEEVAMTFKYYAKIDFSLEGETLQYIFSSISWSYEQGKHNADYLQAQISEEEGTIYAFEWQSDEGGYTSFSKEGSTMSRINDADSLVSSDLCDNQSPQWACTIDFTTYQHVPETSLYVSTKYDQSGDSSPYPLAEIITDASDSIKASPKQNWYVSSGPAYTPVYVEVPSLEGLPVFYRLAAQFLADNEVEGWAEACADATCPLYQAPADDADDADDADETPDADDADETPDADDADDADEAPDADDADVADDEAPEAAVYGLATVFNAVALVSICLAF